MPDKDQPTATAKDTKSASPDGDYSMPARTGADQSPAAPSATATATPDPTQDVPSAERRAPSAKDKNPACPTCAGPLERYVGTNIHKLLSGWCRRCGMRYHLEG